jgi:hypothetical protein
MLRISRPLIAIGAVLAAGICLANENSEAANDPPSQPSTVAATPQTDAPSVDGHAVANKPERKVLVDDSVTSAQLKQILGKGYRPESQARGNEVYYCRSEHELGSRFETKVCRTAARILQDEIQGKEATTSVEHEGSSPPK